MATELFDVVQIGYGPVGQTLAALLGQQGHSVAVFERWPSLYGFARAGHIDHEIMRILQSIGVADAFEKVTEPVLEYDWFNADGKVLIHGVSDGESPSGWPADFLFYQPELEDLLHQATQSKASVEVNLGWEAIALSQRDDHVEITLRKGNKGPQGQWIPTGEMRTVKARFLIGADGANSFVRQSLDINWEDLGFAENWLVIDYRPNDPEASIDMPVMAQLCDPARPTTLGHQGSKYYRWEFMLLPGENPTDMAAPEKVWELLSRWVKPGDGQLLRHVVYMFRSTLTEKWRKERVLLVGDAAHLMPPFLGQGLCSGLRDVKNLSWKLDLVLRGVVEAALLDTYMEERKPHVRSVIEQSIAFGKIICITDPVMAAGRDQFLLSGAVPPPPMFPGLIGGVLHHDAHGVLVPPAGQLSVQGRVSYQGNTGRFDDVVGKGWMVISPLADLRSALNAEQLAFLEELGAKIVQVVGPGTDNQHAVIDLDGTYARYFAQTELEIVIARPDFYVFGGASTPAGLASLMDELHSHFISSQQPTIA